ncbi:Lrp/AsnC family transcriptional regulator [Kineosporia sp. A_224]|uniref:Lrp/AsnC family transcriptional regulator n=1 Tax=Kineosporia sp. A_224 TaxID=1962180 RepID=UPI000B4ADC3F|nr:Lrp/AsnC family transcriptional regulator [Kineosporia sp. A_224]
MALDRIDEQLVALLQDDARSTFADLGAAVGLSAPAAKRRVDRLRTTGVITGFTAVVDPAALGWTTEAYVELFCAPRTTPAAVFAVAAKHPQVVSSCTVSGEANALLHLRAADVHDFERILERIEAEPVVVRTKSVIVLSRGPSRSTTD